MGLNSGEVVVRNIEDNLAWTIRLRAAGCGRTVSVSAAHAPYGGSAPSFVRDGACRGTGRSGGSGDVRLLGARAAGRRALGERRGLVLARP
jgi:hypothetical protein